MFDWLKRRWPLMWKTTCIDWMDDISDDLADALVARNAAESAETRLKEKVAGSAERAFKAEKALESANVQMGSMQRQFIEIIQMSSDGNEWKHYADKVIMAVDGKHGHVECFVGEPMEFTRASAIGSMRKTSVELVKFGVAVGLSADCPPELVANSIADKVRFDILSHWRDKSILLRGVDVPEPAAVG